MPGCCLLALFEIVRDRDTGSLIHLFFGAEVDSSKWLARFCVVECEVQVSPVLHGDRNFERLGAMRGRKGLLGFYFFRAVSFRLRYKELKACLALRAELVAPLDCNGISLSQIWGSGSHLFNLDDITVSEGFRSQLDGNDLPNGCSQCGRAGQCDSYEGGDGFHVSFT